MTFDELDTSTQVGKILHAAVAMLMLDAYTDKTPNQVMEKLTRIADEVWKPDPLHEAMYPRTIEEHVKQANETLAAIRAEIDAMEHGVIPDMNEPLYRKAPPFNPIPLTDGKAPAEVAMEMREWGKIGDRPIIRYDEVNPALAHALYIGGVPVEKGTGMCWTQIPWEKDGNNCPYEWFVNEAKYGAKYRKRVNSDDENRSPG